MSRACIQTFSLTLRARLARLQPGPRETPVFAASTEPGSDMHFASQGLGCGAAPANLSRAGCIPEAWLGKNQATNQPLYFFFTFNPPKCLVKGLILVSCLIGNLHMWVKMTVSNIIRQLFLRNSYVNLSCHLLLALPSPSSHWS
jgi:hypothetical protein